MQTLKKWLSNPKTKQVLINYFLITFGCLILAAGTVAFLLPLDLVTGGVSGVSVILNHYLEPIFGFPTQDIIAWIVQVILLVTSFIFLGKKFTLHTIYATLLYPAFLTLFMRTHVLDFISDALNPAEAGDMQIVIPCWLAFSVGRSPERALPSLSLAMGPPEALTSSPLLWPSTPR